MSKIVFFDIDGTLLDDDKNLPSSTKAAVKALQENGIYTAIATGRGPFMVTQVINELDIDSYVAFNGQFVVFEKEVIYKNPFNPTELKRFASEANKRNHPLVYMSEKTLKGNVEKDKRIADSMASLQLVHPDVDPDYYVKEDIYQTLLYAKEDEEEYLSAFEDIYTFIRWHKEAMDVVPKGGSKAEGIKILIERLGFKMEDVYAFGDGLNDIEMLKTVGTGVAMGNAHEAVKLHADIVTERVENNGIAVGLKKVGLLDDSFEII